MGTASFLSNFKSGEFGPYLRKCSV